MTKTGELDNGDESQEFIVEDEEVRGLVCGQVVQQLQQQHTTQPNSRRRNPPTARERDSEDELYDELFDEEEITEAEEEDVELRGEETRDQGLNNSSLNWSLRNTHRRYHHHHSRLDPEESSSETTMSLSLSDRNRDHSTASLLDSMERRTQRTYRYGIGLVCVGATLNWLGFAQGHGYVDPLRYLGVACVISGSFCVCLAMCRWLGRPISVSSHRVSGLSRLDYQDDRNNGRQNGDVHVINVSVPMYVPPMHQPTKPPDYEIAVSQEPPPYDEAIKLSPGALFTNSSVQTNSDFFTCGHPSPSHSNHTNLITPQSQSPNTQSNPNSITTTTLGNLQTENHHHGSSFLPDSVVVMVDASECASSLNAKIGPPPAYTPRHGLSSSSSSQFDGSSLNNSSTFDSRHSSTSSSNNSTNASYTSSGSTNNSFDTTYTLAPVHSYNNSAHNANTMHRNATNQRQNDSTPSYSTNTNLNNIAHDNVNSDVTNQQFSSFTTPPLKTPTGSNSIMGLSQDTHSLPSRGQNDNLNSNITNNNNQSATALSN